MSKTSEPVVIVEPPVEETSKKKFNLNWKRVGYVAAGLTATAAVVLVAAKLKSNGNAEDFVEALSDAAGAVVEN